MKGMFITLALIFLAGCPAPEPDTSTSAQTPNDLVGVWELASYSITNSDGIARFPFGKQPRGQIVYTESGRMSAQLMSSDYDLGSYSGLDGPAALRELGVSAFFAYWGTYEVDETAGTVTHVVEGCLYPDWVGISQVRNFRFEDADNLVLWAQLPDVSDPGDLYELRWVRTR